MPSSRDSKSKNVKLKDANMTPMKFKVAQKQGDPRLVDPQEKTDACIVDPENKLYRVWEWIVVLVIEVVGILVSFMAAFNSTYIGLWAVVYLCDIVNILDVIGRFFSPYTNELGAPIRNRKQIRKRYLRREFVLDILAVFPFEILAPMIHIEGYSVTRLLSLFRLNRLMRIWRVNQFFDLREEKLGSDTMSLRGMKYFFICIFVTHLTTCAWFGVACVGKHEPGAVFECRQGSWANNEFFDLGFNMSDAGTSRAYTVSAYWASATASSTGYGDISAVNFGERWLSILAQLCGMSLFFGMLLGGMSSMFTNFDQQRADFFYRVERIKQHLVDERICQALQRQVVDFYEYYWRRQKGVSFAGAFDNLPITFQADICASMNIHTLKQSKILSDLEEEFLRMMSTKLVYMLCLPGEIVVRSGDAGHTMFFVHKGELEVLADDEETPVAILKAGAYFGEVGLLYSWPRTATIRAKAYCDLLVLDRADVEPILAHYPEVRERLMKEAANMLKKAKGGDLKTFSKVLKAAKPTGKSNIAINASRRRSFFAPEKSSHGLTINKPIAKEKLSETIDLIQTLVIDEEATDSKPKERDRKSVV